MLNWILTKVRELTGTERAEPLIKTPSVTVKLKTAPAAKAVKPQFPKVCRNTTLFAQVDGAGAWEFCAPACACAKGAALNGKRIGAEHGVALPMEGCDKVSCDCFYKHVSDVRQKPRRQKEERREEIRFDTTKVERRKGGRRNADKWDRKRT
jgi:hypothetical protein